MSTIKKRVHSDWALAVVFLSGIILCGSSGRWFPYLNLAGLSLVWMCGILAQNRVGERFQGGGSAAAGKSSIPRSEESPSPGVDGAWRGASSRSLSTT